jgi:hypothetical protein
MTKNNQNIINFPVEKKSQKKSKKVKKDNEIINHLLQDIEKRQIFLKDYTRGGDKYLIPENIDKVKIKRSDDIILPINTDTEFTDYVGNLNKITYEELAKNNDKFKVQYLRQQSFLTHKTAEAMSYLRGIKLEDIASGLIKELPIELLKDLEDAKSASNQMISSQFKHCLYEDSILFFNPKIKNLISQYVGNKELFYKEKWHVLDYLKQKGMDVEIIRKNPDLSRKDFHKNVGKNEDGTKIPTCTITIYAFFLLAELCKIFEGELLDDIITAIRKNKIQMNRRVSTGMMKKFFPNWLIVINGIAYKVAIDFADTGALQGNISFSDNLKNLEMGTDAKNLMDDYKSNMLYGLLKHPEDWKKYALGDLSVYDVYKNFSKLFEKVYEQVNIPDMYLAPKLTIGTTVNDLSEAILLNHLGYKYRDKEILEDLYEFTIYGSPKNIGNYTNEVGAKKDENRIRKKHTGAKVGGGRCFLNKQVILATSNYTLCDIDISSAYTSIASTLSFYFGNPVVQSFKSHKVTLREFLKHYNKKLLKRGFKLIVETKELLTHEQDLLVSFPNLRFAKNPSYDKNGSITKIDYSVNTDNMETAIYTTDLHNTPLSWDDLNIILYSWQAEQREEFLDKITMISAVYYPKNMECKTIEELREKQITHAKNDNGRFKDAMPFSWIDNEDGELSHYWYSTNFGKLMMTDIIQLRRRNKKTNFSLSYLFKLIGNTVYGDAVSKHFKISNVIFASNITAMCRAAMWCAEKALDIHQTITDGGIFFLNEVLHKYRDKLDASSLVRAYCNSKKTYSRYKKWQKKPITKDGKKIEYIKGKGWLCDGILYEFDYDKVKPLEENYLKLKSELGEKHEKTKKANKLLEDSLKGLNDFLKTINRLALKHVKSQFPNVDLFNGEFDKIKTDDKGIAITDYKGDYIYEKVNGLLEFEVKNMCNWSVFHGSADYMYNNTTNNLTTKMRGYESKKGLLAVKMENDKFIYDENYYNDIPPTQRFLEDLKLNPNNVSIPLSYFKSAILKINDFKRNYKKMWIHTNLLPGDTIRKFMTIPIYSMRHKFRTYKQHKNWQKYQSRLKRRGGGLGFEQFYLNDDGTIRYQDMLQNIDKYIREGVDNPAKVFDKNNHFFRDMKYKKNQKKYQIILNHIKLTTTMKNLNRILTVGLSQFCYENMKTEKDGMVILRRTLKNISSDYSNDYEDLNKYSFDYEFRDRELKLAI